MSNTMNWIMALLNEQDETLSLKRQLQAKEDRITDLETENARLRLVLKIVSQQIPYQVSVTKTVSFL